MVNLIRSVFLVVLISSSFANLAPGLANPSQKTLTQAVSELPAEQLSPVLSPDNFFGPAAMGYAAAKAVPHICSKLFCYCGCDITDGHKSLLDCFTGLHGTDCHICQEEAMSALRLTRDGEALPSIQKAIDDGYSSKYPFKTESPALVHYKTTRLWTGSGAGGTTNNSIKHEKACCAPKSRAVLHSCCAE